MHKSACLTRSAISTASPLSSRLLSLSSTPLNATRRYHIAATVVLPPPLTPHIPHQRLLRVEYGPAIHRILRRVHGGHAAPVSSFPLSSKLASLPARFSSLAPKPRPTPPHRMSPYRHASPRAERNLPNFMRQDRQAWARIVMYLFIYICISSSAVVTVLDMVATVTSG
jgi:hypothetical protein